MYKLLLSGTVNCHRNRKQLQSTENQASVDMLMVGELQKCEKAVHDVSTAYICLRPEACELPL